MHPIVLAVLSVLDSNGPREAAFAASEERTVSTIRCTEGTARSSRCSPDGNGMWGVAIRPTGSSRYQNGFLNHR